MFFGSGVAVFVRITIIWCRICHDEAFTTRGGKRRTKGGGTHVVVLITPKGLFMCRCRGGCRGGGQLLDELLATGKGIVPS